MATRCIFFLTVKISAFILVLLLFFLIWWTICYPFVIRTKINMNLVRNILFILFAWNFLIKYSSQSLIWNNFRSMFARVLLGKNL
jgi:hypothetical protein